MRRYGYRIKRTALLGTLAIAAMVLTGCSGDAAYDRAFEACTEFGFEALGISPADPAVDQDVFAEQSETVRQICEENAVADRAGFIADFDPQAP